MKSRAADILPSEAVTSAAAWLSDAPPLDGESRPKILALSRPRPTSEVSVSRVQKRIALPTDREAETAALARRYVPLAISLS
jgi:hypothetical protein